MNYSAIFSNAHAQAKATVGLFNSYRLAFSIALSNEMRAAWLKVRLEAKKAVMTLKNLIGAITGAKISNVAAKAINSDFECVELFNSNGVVITIQNTATKNLSLSIHTEKATFKHDVAGIDDTKSILNAFAESLA